MSGGGGQCGSGIRVLLGCLGVLLPFMSFAQDTAWSDTLQAAVKTDVRRVEMSLGRLKTGLEGIRNVVSPLGEGDPIRWVLGLPGVTSGADGTTSMYIRGGGTGNNLFSLDGVPVYGYSHILGLTTVVPTGVIESAELGKGGFDGAESNFTAAHLRIVTKGPAGKQKTSISLNNFLLSAGAEGPLGRNLSYIVSARISPLTWEYSAVKGMLPDLLGGLDRFKATVGDLYAKLLFRMDGQSTLTASFLGSQDLYGFNMPDASHEQMGWHNLVGMVKWHREGERTGMDATVSLNGYGNFQKQEKIYRGAPNTLSLRSNLTEATLDAGMHHLLGEHFRLAEGIHLRSAWFTPGQVGETSRVERSLFMTGWVQADYRIPDHLMLKVAVRANYYQMFDLLPGDDNARLYGGAVGSHADPELSFSGKWNFTRHLALEATYDRLVQYYHALEGLPVGWSLDMLVPTGERVRPERSRQAGAGLSGRFGALSFSLGGFYKQMENLVYYKYSQALFSGALGAWERYVEFGNGRSYGLEVLSELQKGELYARLSYTLSKTTREDFPTLADGQPFHARFDRRHVLNATAQWRGFTATVILQSGHWENGAAEMYELPFLADSWQAEYYFGLNNFQMPTIFRLDLGWQKSFRTGRVEHTVNLGVCNVTNHFNPFLLYFDTRSESWRELALLPILPNFSYRVAF